MYCRMANVGSSILVLFKRMCLQPLKLHPAKIALRMSSCLATSPAAESSSLSNNMYIFDQYEMLFRITISRKKAQMSSSHSEGTLHSPQSFPLMWRSQMSLFLCTILAHHHLVLHLSIQWWAKNWYLVNWLETSDCLQSSQIKDSRQLFGYCMGLSVWHTDECKSCCFNKKRCLNLYKCS